MLVSRVSSKYQYQPSKFAHESHRLA